MFDLNKVYSAENGANIFFKYIKVPRADGKCLPGGLLFAFSPRISKT